MSTANVPAVYDNLWLYFIIETVKRLSVTVACRSVVEHPGFTSQH